MSFDGNLYFYGAVCDKNGNKLTGELQYSVDVTDYLEEFFINDEKLFDCFDDLEDKWETVPSESIREAMSYLAFCNDWVDGCRIENENEFIQDYLESDRIFNGDKEPDDISFQVERIRLFGQCR